MFKNLKDKIYCKQGTKKKKKHFWSYNTLWVNAKSIHRSILHTACPTVWFTGAFDMLVFKAKRGIFILSPIFVNELSIRLAQNTVTCCLKARSILSLSGHPTHDSMVHMNESLRVSMLIQSIITIWCSWHQLSVVH